VTPVHDFVIHFGICRKKFGKYSIVQPGNVSPMRLIPDHIPKPNYYKTGAPILGPKVPEIKNEEQIRKMRDSCKLAAFILDLAGKSLHVLNIVYPIKCLTI
jgi:hypothetical protein